MQPDRHDSAVGPTADRTIDTDEPRRTPVARPDEPAAPRFSGEGAGGCGELDGGCGLHTPTIMTKGYPTVRRGSQNPGPGEPPWFPETWARGTLAGQGGSGAAEVEEELCVGEAGDGRGIGHRSDRGDRKAGVSRQ